MSKNNPTCQVVPFPKVRLRITDFLRLMHEKHLIHSLTELDVTKPREYIRQHKAKTGEGLSFTAFFIACLSKAVDEDKYMHAYRKWGNRLVLFDEVDVTTVVEHQMDEVMVATPYIIRAANRKTFREIHSEIRASQQEAREFKKMPWYEDWFFSLPTALRLAVFRLVGDSPSFRKRIQGTVAVTAVGMFGRGSAWGIPMTVYTLCLTLGGISEKPGVVQGKIEVREYLSLTVSVDHDVVDGAPLARFMTRLKELVESGYGLAEPAM